MHISDLHYDPDYLVGSEAQCSEPLCCRYNTPNITHPASVWGDYRCDIPKKMFQAYLQQISSLSPPPDVVIWTGDNTPHDIWEESIEQQLDRIFRITAMVQQAFPRTPVFPAMGNQLLI